jgi:hypothetical protein
MDPLDSLPRCRSHRSSESRSPSSVSYRASLPSSSFLCCGASFTCISSCRTEPDALLPSMLIVGEPSSSAALLSRCELEHETMPQARARYLVEARRADLVVTDASPRCRRPRPSVGLALCAARRARTGRVGLARSVSRPRGCGSLARPRQLLLVWAGRSRANCALRTKLEYGPVVVGVQIEILFPFHFG